MSAREDLLIRVLTGPVTSLGQVLASRTWITAKDVRDFLASRRPRQYGLSHGLEHRLGRPGRLLRLLAAWRATRDLTTSRSDPAPASTRDD